MPKDLCPNKESDHSYSYLSLHCLSPVEGDGNTSDVGTDDGSDGVLSCTYMSQSGRMALNLSLRHLQG